jgi:ribosome-associated protein
MQPTPNPFDHEDTTAQSRLPRHAAAHSARPLRADRRIDADGYVIRDNRSQKKREADTLHAVGEALVTAKSHDIRAIPLPESLADIIAEAREITAHGGRKRQLLYLAKWLREWSEIAPDEIAPVLSWFHAKHRDTHRAASVSKAVCHWSQDLVPDGKLLLMGHTSKALTAFMSRYPNPHEQKIVQLMKVGQSASGGGKRARQKLLELLQTIIHDVP